MTITFINGHYKSLEIDNKTILYAIQHPSIKYQ